MKDKPLYLLEIYKTASGRCLTIYKAKKKRVARILSSTHRAVAIAETHKKKISKTAVYYDTSKVGVDILDQMARYHPCETTARK